MECGEHCTRDSASRASAAAKNTSTASGRESTRPNSSTNYYGKNAYDIVNSLPICSISKLEILIASSHKLGNQFPENALWFKSMELYIIGTEFF
jgi:hypothetical protein